MLSRKGLIMSMLTLLVILGIWAVLKYLSFMQNKQLDAVANSLSSSLNFARLEAVKRGRAVSVCPKAPKEVACDTSANWAEGWIVFQETDHLLVHEPLPREVTVTANTNIVNYTAVGGVSSTPLRVLIQPKTFCRVACVVTVSARGQLNIEHIPCGQ